MFHAGAIMNPRIARMTDDLKIRIAVISLLCLLPAVSAIVAVFQAGRRFRRIHGQQSRGFGVIVKK